MLSSLPYRIAGIGLIELVYQLRPEANESTSDDEWGGYYDVRAIICDVKIDAERQIHVAQPLPQVADVSSPR